MTELRIDGVAVELPASFSISIKRENPFFTKSGEYTYDIELPLESSVNAELYSFLHRINSVTDIKDKRKAVLIADNRVYLDGTEIITGWTDKNVKIQLVSGNSELNYLADEKTLISELKMRTTDPRVNGAVTDTILIDKYYPEIDYCLPMVVKPDGTFVNQWLLSSEPITNAKAWIPVDFDEEYGLIPQPYLIPYLKNLIEALGYKVSFNALDNTFAKYIILIHSQRTYDWALFFPGMTAREFLENVENTFNVSFRIDFRKKEVAILLNRSYFFEVPNAYVQNVVDEYDCDLDDNVSNDIAYNSKSYKLSYDFPSTKYYNEAELSQYVKNVALIVDDRFTGTYWEYFEKDDKSTEKIYKISGDIEKARYDGYHHNDKQNMTGYPMYHYVDFFAQHKTGNGDVDVRMKILPAEIIQSSIVECDGYPIVVAGDTIPKNTEDIKLDDLLALDKKDEGSAGSLRMAFYKGKVKTYPSDSRVLCPTAFTHFYMRVGNRPRNVGIDPPLSLRPADMAVAFFDGGYDIDISHPLKIQSFDVNLYDPSSVFIIHNKRFLCKDIEYVIGPNGRVGAWQGTFYPVKLPDTEAYKRWILNDGRWRDGGVWLDDGRWLDDKPINHDKNTDTI